MINFRSVLSSRAGRRRGFTLVELLVVIAIISVLLSVLVPAAWKALETGRQSAATQSSRGIGQLMTQYGLDKGQYPDAATSTDAFKLMISSGYLSNPSVFYISGGQQTKFKGTSPATNLTASNVSYDIIGRDGTGSTSGPQGMTISAPAELPLVFSTGCTITIPTAAGPGMAQCSGTAPFTSEGIAVTYKDNHSEFRQVDSTTGGGTISDFIVGSFDPGGVTYTQRKP